MVGVWGRRGGGESGSVGVLVGMMRGERRLEGEGVRKLDFLELVDGDDKTPFH